MGSVPDGFYEVAEEVEKAAKLWTPSERRELVKELQTAQLTNEPSAARDAISSRSGMQGVLQRLAPKTAGEFWTLVGIILTVVSMITADSGDRTTNVYDPTINVNVPVPGSLTTPQQSPRAAESEPAKKKPPLPPKKQRERRRRQRKGK